VHSRTATGNRQEVMGNGGGESSEARSVRAVWDVCAARGDRAAVTHNRHSTSANHNIIRVTFKSKGRTRLVTLSMILFRVLL